LGAIFPSSWSTVADGGADFSEALAADAPAHIGAFYRLRGAGHLAGLSSSGRDHSDARRHDRAQPPSHRWRSGRQCGGRRMTIDNAKAQAKALRAALQAQGTAISHAQALELIARQHGARDWNTLHARLAL